MIRIEHTHYIHFVQSEQDSDLSKLVKLIFNQNKTIMSELTDVKEKLAVSDQKIDILTQATVGIKQDVTFIKKKLDEAGSGGIDATGVAELKGIIENQNARLTTVAQQLTDLDAETDSSEQVPT